MLYDFSFYNPTRIHFGKKALQHLHEEIAHFGPNILLVYGKNSIKRIGLYDEIIAMEGIAALDEFIRELGIPSSLRELGATEEMLEPIAASTEANIIARYGEGVTGYKKIRHNEILEILQNCF